MLEIVTNLILDVSDWMTRPPSDGERTFAIVHSAALGL
jgi:hypothetical protein